MKIKNWIYLTGLVVSFSALISCGEDEKDEPCAPTTWYQDKDGDGLGNPAVSVEECEQPEGYVANADDDDDSGSTTISAEQHKEILQDEGLAFVGEMNQMEQGAAAQTLVAFRVFIETSEPSNGRVESVNNVVDRIISLTKREISPVKFASTTTDPEPEEEFNSIDELWNEYKGVYEWNASIADWEYTAGGDVIQFLFPSDENSTINNAALTVQNYEGVIISNPIEEEYSGDLPSEFLMDLVVDDVKELEYGFSIDYSDEGEPEMLETHLFVNPFTLTYELTNTETKIGTGFSFENATQELLGSEIEINGNFDDDIIEEAMDLEDPTLVVSDGSLEFRIMNVKFLGEMDFADLYPKVEAVFEGEDEPGYDHELKADELAAALNEHISIGTSYIDTGDKIADVEFYTYVEVDEFFPEDKYIELGGRLLFADGSKIDLEDYFEDGWQEIEDELEALFDAIEEDIGS